MEKKRDRFFEAQIPELPGERTKIEKPTTTMRENEHNERVRQRTRARVQENARCERERRGLRYGVRGEKFQFSALGWNFNSYHFSLLKFF